MTRLLSRLLSRVTGPSLADSILGDLDEEHTRRAQASPFRATCWYWREALLVLIVVTAQTAWSSFKDVLRCDMPSGVRIVTDVRHAWRSLYVHRGSSLAIVAVLALGIGLTSAMFALADPFVLRPLPFAKPHELVVIDVGSEDLTENVTTPTVDDWRARKDLFQGLTAIGAGRVERLRLTDRSTFFVTATISADLFAVLGVPAPQMDEWTDAAAVPSLVLLTAQAARVLPAEARQPGTFLPLQNGGGLRVVGTMIDDVLLPGTGLDRNVHGLKPFVPGPLFQATTWYESSRQRPPRTNLQQILIARLQPDVTPQMVEAALSVALPSGARLAVTADPLSDYVTRSKRPLAQGAIAAGVFILLICAGNVANLLLARLTFRSRELATRAALGASRGDLLRLWLTEIGVVATLAIGFGLAIASLALTIVTRVIPEAYVSLGSPSITARVVIFAMLAGSLIIVPGLIPLAGRHRRESLALFGHAVAADSRRVATFRFASVALQSTLAMILAVGAALLIQSHVNLIGQNSGFDGTALTVTAMYPSSLRDQPLQEVLDGSLERLRRVPGVTAAAVADGAVVDGVLTTAISLQATARGQAVDAQLRSVSDNYFETAGMTVLQGHGLRAHDHVLVNEALASKYWPGESALGQPTSAGTIVGIVRDAHERVLYRRPDPTVYKLLSARFGDAEDILRGRVSSGVTYVLRTSASPIAHEPAIRRALFDVYSDVLIPEVNTFDGKLANTVRDRTFAALILTFFGIAGGAVTVAGLVGIVAFVVVRRTREIAIRIAIGAQPGHIRGLVTREVISAAIAGGIAGLLIGRWLSTWLESFVYGVEAGNWTTALMAGGVMLAVMIGAALVPARRAVNLHPTEALRVE